MTPAFNKWWDSSGPAIGDNPYRVGSPAYWAWVGWNAGAGAEREACARIIEAHQVPVGNSAAGELAAEWTMDALREVRDAIRARGEK